MVMKRACAVLVMLSVGTGCATKSGSIGTAIVGAAALAGGIALVATDEDCVGDGCWFPSGQSVGGAVLIALGAGMIVGGAIGYGRAEDRERDRPATPPAPTVAPAPDAPLLVDPARKDTPAERAALQASYAARRADCPATRVAMDQLRALDAALHATLSAQDAPIARCLAQPAAP